MFKLEFETDNAAFEDDVRGESARVLREIADLMEFARHDEGKARDVNGNTVGSWSLT